MDRQGNRLQLWSRFLTVLCAIIALGVLMGVVTLVWKYSTVEARQQGLEQRIQSTDNQRRLTEEVSELRKAMTELTRTAAASAAQKTEEIRPAPTTAPTSRPTAAAIVTTQPAAAAAQTQPATIPLLPPTTAPSTQPLHPERTEPHTQP